MLEKKAKDNKTAYEKMSSTPMVKVGYEVYADGLTRVIRICEVSKSLKGDSVFHSRSKIQFRMTHLGIHLLEKVKQVSLYCASLFCPVISVLYSCSCISLRRTPLPPRLNSVLKMFMQSAEEKPVVSFSPILVARLENLGLQSMFTDQQKFNQLCIEVYFYEVE